VSILTTAEGRQRKAAVFMGKGPKIYRESAAFFEAFQVLKGLGVNPIRCIWLIVVY
jgi:hypothetical protein